MNIKIGRLLAIANLLINNTIKADQPVKCLKEKGEVNYIGGIWTFHVMNDKDTINLYKTKEVCTH